MIEDANVIISTYESGDTLQVDPSDGSVAFGSGYFGWAFTLNKFARYFAEKFKIDMQVLMKRLWGDNYYNPTLRQFQRTSQADES